MTAFCTTRVICKDETYLVQQDGEVLELRRSLSGLRRDRLELLNRGRGAKNALGSACSDLGSLSVLGTGKQRVEPADKEVLGSSQVVADCYPQRQVRVLQHRRHVRDDVLLVYRHGKHLTETKRLICMQLSRQEKNRLI